MAVHKSNLITARDTAGSQIERGLQGVERVAIAQYTSAGAIADNDVIVLAEIPVNARITSIRLWTTDHGTTGTFNLGFHKPTVAASSYTDTIGVVDEDILATAVDINAAALADTELRYEVKAITTADDPAWELAGLSARPAYGTLVLTATMAQATTAAGTFVFIIRYTE